MKTFKLLLILAVLVAAVMLAFSVFPAYYDKYVYQNYIDDQLKVQSYIPGRTESDVADVFAQRAAEMKLPLTADQIHVTRLGNDWSVEAEYVVHIDYFLHPFDMTFHIRSHNRSI